MEILFEARTPPGVRVRTTARYWRDIVENKHPIMEGKLEQVRATLEGPREVRRSQSDPTVYLYYQVESNTPYWLCVVVKHLNGEGFIITAYRTDRIKEGNRAWTS